MITLPSLPDLQLDWPSGRAILTDTPGQRFLGTPFGALAKERCLSPKQANGHVLGLIERTVSLARTLLPGLDLGSRHPTLYSAIAAAQKASHRSCDIPVKIERYQKVDSAKPGADEIIITVQAIRQKLHQDWLSLPYPTGEAQKVPGSIFFGKAQIEELLSWGMPSLTRLSQTQERPATLPAISSGIERGHWFTDSELNVVASANPWLRIEEAWVFDRVYGDPLQAPDSPFMALSHAWGLTLEAIALSRLTGPRATTAGLWLQGRDFAWATTVINCMQKPQIRVLGYGGGRVHVAVPRSDLTTWCWVGNAAASSDAYAYTQDGRHVLPSDQELVGSTALFVDLLRKGEQEKLELTDSEVQKVLTNATTRANIK